MIFVTWLDQRTTQSIRLEISAQGHSFLTLVVAFLLVSRVNTGLTRYNETRGYIGAMYQHVRELVQGIAIFSSRNNTTSLSDDDVCAAAQWRHDVAYQGLLLLRTAMVVMDYPVDMVLPWEIPELNGDETEFVRNGIFLNHHCNNNTSRWAHRVRTEWEEAMRVPIRIGYLLHKTIHSQNHRLNHELRLHANVDAMMNGYYGIRKFLTTPVPFPLIQMARTFLFLYVFTIPLVLLSDHSSLMAHCFMVFLLTYGFVGLEIVSIELDNPFGNDANDFNNSAMADVAFEDCYLTILDVDGPEWTDKLRARMGSTLSSSPMTTNGLRDGAASEATPLL